MKRSGLLAALVVVALAAPGCVVSSDDGDSTLTIENESSYALAEIHVTAVDSSTWGPNLLGGDLLYPGEVITVVVECDTYDALVVDEHGVGCELHGLDLCFDDAVWTVTNGTLDHCGF